MTLSTVLGVVAGRVLDALVAEKVMGWTLKGDTYARWVNDKDEYMGPCENVDFWSPSTSIAAAWEVVERLGADDYTFFKFSSEVSSLHMYSAEEAALEICLAALAAVGALPTPQKDEDK